MIESRYSSLNFFSHWIKVVFGTRKAYLGFYNGFVTNKPNLKKKKEKGLL